jgi:hypothetical protein
MKKVFSALRGHRLRCPSKSLADLRGEALNPAVGDAQLFEQGESALERT